MFDNAAAFIWAVGSHWVASMSGVVAIGVGIIQYLRQTKFHPSTWVFIGIGCLFIACYQAWLDEHEARINADIAFSPSPYHWQMLSPSEALALRSEMRDITPEGEAMFILCAEADCDDLAKSFRDVFRDLHWKVDCCASSFSTFDPGVHLWASKPHLREIAGKIELATKGRLKVDTSGNFTMDPDRFHLQITIGPKPETQPNR
jgi:hypothetical protein